LGGQIRGCREGLPVAADVIVSKDGKTAQEHGEILEDGKGWIPFFVASCTRVEAAAK
jgi:hypothetical protein